VEARSGEGRCARHRSERSESPWHLATGRATRCVGSASAAAQLQSTVASDRALLEGAPATCYPQSTLPDHGPAQADVAEQSLLLPDSQASRPLRDSVGAETENVIRRLNSKCVWQCQAPGGNPPDGQALPDRGVPDEPAEKTPEHLSAVTRCHKPMTRALA